MYIFDIDGTLSDASHRVHLLDESPKNWDEFFRLAKHDSPIAPTVSILRRLIEHHPILLVTGRKDSDKEMTIGWLNEHNIPFDSIYMRAEGDRRDDWVIKEELYKTRIAPQYGPAHGVFEDRSRVVKMWRDLGLVCYQVCEGNY